MTYIMASSFLQIHSRDCMWPKAVVEDIDMPTAISNSSLTAMTSELDAFKQFARPLGWVVDAAYKIIVCTNCGAVVNPRKPAEHLAHSGKSRMEVKTLKATLEEYKDIFEQFTDAPTPPTTPVNSIPGLRVHPVMQVCQTCKHGYSLDQDQSETDARQSKSFKSHKCGMSSGTPRKFLYRPCQRFGPSSPYFEVNARQAPVSGSEFWKNYQETQALRPRSDPTVSCPHDDRAMSRFLHEQGWVQHLEGRNLASITQLCLRPSKDDPYLSLVPRLHAYLAFMQRCIRSHALRRKIGLKPSTEHERSYERHHRDVNYGTHQKYALRLAESLCLLLRNVSDPQEQYSFTVPPEIREIVVSLDKMLKNDVLSEDYDVEDSIAHDEDDDEDDEDDMRENGDDTSDISFGTDTLQPVIPTPYTSAEWRPIPFYQDKTQETLIQLLEHLYTQGIRDGKDDPFRSAFMRYIVLSSVKASGQWLPANLITQTISPILFVGRVTLGRMMLVAKARSPNMSLDE